METKNMIKIVKVVFLTLMIGICCCGCSNHKTQEQTEDSNSYADDRKYDYSEQATEYLEVIGTKFTNRNLLSTGTETEENSRQEFVNWILEELKEAGYSDDDIERDYFSVYGQDDIQGQNIVVTLQGKDYSKQVIVGAHYDGDGVGDNASGVALLLANACGLANSEPDTTVKFIFFDGEEEGELGSSHYVENMTDEEVKQTIYMINIDSIAFGDYCNVYGGETNFFGSLVRTSGYEAAMDRAEQLGFQTYRTEELDGYYEAYQTGPEPEADTLYTNPWTKKHPSPENFDYPSPTTGGWGDSAPFSDKGITYIYFEATNWYTDGDGGELAYTGYFDTAEKEIGNNGMFMNTEYDNLENLEKYFSGRAQEHFALYGPLMASLVLHPAE
jgi:hypothetical protein